MAISAQLQSKINNLPSRPGVYQYFDSKGTVVYVGKAKNLKKRVPAYFTRQKYESGKTAALVRKIRDLEYIVVETEWDALLLENSLIKKYQPRYNVLLRDDKSFPWICIKKERFPRIFPTRTVVQDGSAYFGPYASVKMMNAVLELIRQLYPLRNCNFNLSEAHIKSGKFKVCLEYHLGNCLGPCIGEQSAEDYDLQVKHIRDIIRGNAAALTKHFKSLMKQHASDYQFEKAQQIKEKIGLLEKYRSRSVIVNPGIDHTDVYSITSDDTAAYVNYMKVAKGSIVLSHILEMKKKMEERDEDLLSLAIINLMERFGSDAKEIIVPFKLGVTTHGLRFLVPRRGDKKRLLELSQRNVKHYHLNKKKVIHDASQDTNKTRALETLKKDLRLKVLPEHIDCFDNSNIQGDFPVAALVVFIGGQPRKREYRHYNIKTVAGPDDFASMEEVVFRRYQRLLNEGLPLPNLIVVDGGKGQLSAAQKSLKKLKLTGVVNVIGIAKKLEEIYFPNDPVPLYLDKRSESLKLIQRMRDEAHRFGITHHRGKRVKGTLKSELHGIKGIGEATATALLKRFKSVKNVRSSSLEALTGAVGQAKALVVFRHFERLT